MMRKVLVAVFMVLVMVMAVATSHAAFTLADGTVVYNWDPSMCEVTVVGSLGEGESCVNEQVTVSTRCAGGTVYIDYGDGHTSTSAVHSYDAPGTYTIVIYRDLFGVFDVDGDGVVDNEIDPDTLQEVGYIPPDGKVDYTKSVTVVVRDCGTPEEPEEDDPTPSVDTSVNPSTGSVWAKVTCPETGRVGEPVTCTVETDTNHAYAIFWSFTVPVIVNGSEVYRISDGRTLTFTPKFAGELYVIVKAVDVRDPDNSVQAHTIINVAEEQEDDVIVPGRIVSQSLAVCGLQRITCDGCPRGSYYWETPVGVVYDGDTIEVILDPGTHTIVAHIDADGDGSYELTKSGTVYVAECPTVLVYDADLTVVWDGEHLRIWSRVQNEDGYCYYVAAYVPQLDKYFFLKDGKVLEQAEPVICGAGEVTVPVLDLTFDSTLGLTVEIVHGFLNTKTGQLEKVEVVEQLEL